MRNTNITEALYNQGRQIGQVSIMLNGMTKDQLNRVRDAAETFLDAVQEVAVGDNASAPAEAQKGGKHEQKAIHAVA